MCAFYDYKIPTSFLINAFEITTEVAPQRIAPHTLAPAILKRSHNFNLSLMNFSLIPHWSKERKVKFATHNARLFSEGKMNPIYTKPTWKLPFTKNHCIIPMSNFIEPIYTGNYAGKMVAFLREDDSPLLAAGIYDTWMDKFTGEILESYAILTHDPPDFIAKTGHDRCPVFLDVEESKQWIQMTNMESRKQLDFLLKNKKNHSFKVETDRQMAKGWEKRK